MYRHLQNLPIPFKTWDNPFCYSDLNQVVEKLAVFARELNIDVDQEKLNNNDQAYLNYLHKIYEKNYNGNNKWLEYHEHIHLAEFFKLKPDYIRHIAIDYREKAGPLEKKFKPIWNENFTSEVKSGDVYIQFAELGKTPYGYWRDNEPNDLSRLCELAKPRLLLRAKFVIATQDRNFFEGINVDAFNQWWEQYESDWAHHWNVKSWPLVNMQGVNIIGQVSNLDLIVDNLRRGAIPTYIKV